LLQEHELLNLALTQKEEALLEMEQELEGVRREGVKLREEMRRRN
jgi:chromosome segregation ATPase